MEDFEACKMTGNNSTGTWDSEDGLFVCSLHNGGPVNWSSCHRALITCEGLSEASVGKAMADALDKYEEEVGDEESFYLKHFPLHKKQGGQEGIAVMGDFQTMVCVARELLEAELLPAPIVLRR